MAARIGVSVSVARAARLLPLRAARQTSTPSISNSLRALGCASSSFLRRAGAPFAARNASISRALHSSSIVAAWGMAQARTELAPAHAPPGLEIATFAGGCFWGLELAYQREPGVVKTSVGYTQGDVEGPSYQAVCSGRTGHTEAVQVYYDPKEVSYNRLLELFFARVDPTTKDRQGNDSGSQYRSGIYYHNEEQKAAIERAVEAVNEKLQQSTWRKVFGGKVVTEVKPAGDYWLAENYHQQYLQKGGQDASKGATDRIRCYG